MSETNNMTVDQARSLITANQAEVAAGKASAEAAEKAAKEKVEALCVAVGIQKFFKRKREGVDAIGDKTEHYEMIRADERVKNGTGYNTTGISAVDGVRRQVYTLATLSGLELSSSTEFLAEKAKIEAAAAKG